MDKKKFAPIAFCILIVGKKTLITFKDGMINLPHVVFGQDILDKTPQQAAEEVQEKLKSLNSLSVTKPQLLVNTMLQWDVDLKKQFQEQAKTFPSGINLFLYFAYVRQKDSVLDLEKQAMWVDAARDGCDKFEGKDTIQTPVVTVCRVALSMAKIMINQVQDQRKRDEQQALKKLQEGITQKGDEKSSGKKNTQIKFKDIFSVSVDSYTI